MLYNGSEAGPSSHRTSAKLAVIWYPGIKGAESCEGQGKHSWQAMPGADGMSIMPPNFGYPFYQPQSLLTPSASSGGMSM
jgi:hypothetical protein